GAGHRDGGGRGAHLGLRPAPVDRDHVGAELRDVRTAEEACQRRGGRGAPVRAADGWTARTLPPGLAGAAARGAHPTRRGRARAVAITLALSLGPYGLLKRRATVGAVESLTFETMMVGPLAAGSLGWLAIAGTGHFATEGAGHVLLLLSTGIVTAIPLLCFG